MVVSLELEIMTIIYFDFYDDNIHQKTNSLSWMNSVVAESLVAMWSYNLSMMSSYLYLSMDYSSYCLS